RTHLAHEPHGPADARQPGRARAVTVGRVAERLLHDPVLAGVVTENRTPAARGKRVDGLSERVRENHELVVDLDAERLERTLRGMSAPAAGRCGNGVADHLREVSRRGDRSSGDDGARDPRRVALVAVVAYDAGELVDVAAVDDVGRRTRPTTVHAHVERCFEAVAEP